MDLRECFWKGVAIFYALVIFATVGVTIFGYGYVIFMIIMEWINGISN